MVDAASGRTIVLLNENPSINATDKKLLRNDSPRAIVTMSSGCLAAKKLASQPGSAQTMLVVVGGRLSDMSGEQFCAIIRLHPRLVTLPILLIVDSDAAKTEIETLGSAASAILARPFSSETLRETIARLPTRVLPPRTQPDEKLFYAFLENKETLLKQNPHPPEVFYKVGLQCLQQKKINSAISAFTQALASQKFKGEAELGLAAAYSHKGDAREASSWLAQATESMILAQRWDNARAIFARAKVLNEAVRNPFFILARKQIYQGAYAKAAEILAEGLDTIPWVQAGEKIANLCVLAHNPNAMLAKTQDALGAKAENVHCPKDVADHIADILADLTWRVRQKRLEAQERAMRAHSQRTEELSKRMGQNTLAFEPEEAQNIAEKAPDKKPLNTPNDLGLVSLPGDEEDQTQSAQTQPIEQSTHTGFLGDILQIIKLTWRLMRARS